MRPGAYQSGRSGGAQKAPQGSKLNIEHYLRRKAKTAFYNTFPLDLKGIVGDPDNIAGNLLSYLHSFSSDVADIFERFEFPTQIDRLAKAGLLYLVTEKFANIDLHPEVPNPEMGAVFEELIRKFAELSNETAGEHFTPREVIRLMVEPALHRGRRRSLTKPGVVRTIYDPTAGTGGMLSVAGEHLASTTPRRGSSCSGRS